MPTFRSAAPRGRGRAARARHALLSLAALAPLAATALDAQQRPYPSEPPPPAPITPANFPPFQETTLANGLRLVLVQSSEQPVLSVSLAMPAGSAYDPVGKEGLADMVAGLLTKGAGERSAEQISEAIEGVGGSLFASAGSDFLTVGAGVLSPHAALAFELLSDVVRRPAFPESELELARTQTLSGLQLQLTQPASLADRFFNQNLYGEHPYARSSTPASVRAITRDDVLAFQQARLRPQDALLVVAGDITMERARALAEQAFGGWQGAAPAAGQFPAPPQRTSTEIVLVHRPGSVQANLVVGNTTTGPADPIRYASTVGNKILGGGTDARLFMILREERGWTYGAYSGFQRPLGTGSFQASAEVRNEVADSALVELLAQLRRLRSEAVSAEELEAAKSALVGSFPLTVETAAQVANAVSQAKLYGLGTDYLHEYRTRLAGVTAADVQKAAQTAIRPDSALIVVVGDGQVLYDRLRAIAPVRIVSAQGDPLTPEELAPQAATVALDPRRLQARTDSFTVLLQGNPFGYQTTKVEKTGDGWRITEASALGPVLSQTSVLTLDERLQMQSVQQTGKFQGQDTKLAVTYADGRATGTATVPSPTTGQIATTEVNAEVPSGVLDDNALGALLPALPWTADATFTLPVFASGQNTLRSMTLTVTGTESLTIPAGTFQAYRVDGVGGAQPLTFWVEQSAPHRVLKIAPTGAPVEIVRASP